MLRSEKGADGIKGFTPRCRRRAVAAAVTVDAQGRIANREPLTRGGGGQARFAPPPPPPCAAGGRDRWAAAAAVAAAAAASGPGAFVSMFPRRPTRVPAERLEHARSAGRRQRLPRRRQRPRQRGRRSTAATGTFGPVALYVGGTGEVRFKDLALKDLQRRITPAEQVASRFRAQHFEDFYYGWSAAAGDFNHDGVLDVTMGNRYYLGPAFTDSRELYLGQAFNPAKEYTPGDGELRGRLHRRRLGRHPRRRIARAGALREPEGRVAPLDPLHGVPAPVISESIMFKDMNGDGKPDAVFSGSNGAVGERRSGESDRPLEGYAVSTPGRPARASTASAPATSTATARSTSSRRTAGGSSPPAAPR